MVTGHDIYEHRGVCVPCGWYFYIISVRFYRNLFPACRFTSSQDISLASFLSNACVLCIVYIVRILARNALLRLRPVIGLFRLSSHVHTSSNLL